MSQFNRNYVAITGIIYRTIIVVTSLIPNHNSTLTIALFNLVGTILGYVFGVLLYIIKKQQKT